MRSPRPPIQQCPVCGLAMVGSRSDEGNPHLDTFSCLKCETVMTFVPSRKDHKPGK
jgi:hypothetical protein